jgi:hypothetical protein
MLSNMTDTITIETHNDGLNIQVREIPIFVALDEVQLKIDRGVYGGVFALVDALLAHSRQNEHAYAGQRPIARIPARNGMNDPLVDRLEGVNQMIKYATRRGAR